MFWIFPKIEKLFKNVKLSPQPNLPKQKLKGHQCLGKSCDKCLFS